MYMYVAILTILNVLLFIKLHCNPKKLFVVVRLHYKIRVIPVNCLMTENFQ